MRRTYGKNTLRTVKETFGRFAAIFAIVALGVGFLVGLLSSTPDMRYSFDEYFDNTSMYDIRVLGDLGLSDADVSTLTALDGVGIVQAGYVADVLMTSSENTDYTVRMHSIDTKNDDTMNRPELTMGRIPENSNECIVVNVPLSKAKVELGEMLTIAEKNKNTDDILNSKEYTVVGFADYCPYFSAEKEYTNIGSGTVDIFVLVPNESFATDFYTDVYIGVKGADALTSLTGEYQMLVNKTSEKVEAIADERSQVRYDEFVSQSTEKLETSKADYNEAKSEAETKLSDAEKQISDGWREIENGEIQLASAWTKISDNESKLIKSQADLNKQESEMYNAFADALTNINKAQSELDNNLEDAQESQTASESELNTYHLSETQLSAFKELAKLTATYPSLAENLQTLQDNSTRLKEIGTRLAAIGTMQPVEQTTYADEVAALKTESITLQADITKIASGGDYIAYVNGATRLAMTGATSETLPMLALKLGSVDTAIQKLAGGQSELDKQRGEYESKKASAEKEIADARAKISSGKTELANAKEDYYSHLETLSASKASLLESETEYKNSKADAETALAEGAQKIAEAETKLSELRVPSWQVYTRADNISYSSIEANIDKVNAIAKVFPFFFFLVAALVALTTMTRMVEDERLQIGTMKALGYSRSEISRKYIFYALSASVLGSVFGVAVGYRLFPSVIWNAYTMMYELPKFYCPLNWMFALLTSAAAVACTLLATVSACGSSLKEKPAQLMLLRAPEAGKRVLLERITPIWSRMKFTHKVTARNLFRYKKRFLMTVIGVAGCTALVVTGFGLRDSFSDIADRQFGTLNTYDIMVPIANEDDLTNPELQDILNNSESISDKTTVYYESVDAENGDSSLEIYAFIPESTSDLDGFVSFRNRASGKALSFEEGSVIITEKASEILKLKVGSVLMLTDPNGNTGSFKISGICENYARNYVYMSKTTYTEGMGQRPEANMLVIGLTDSGLVSQRDIGERILETGAVSGISYISDSKDAVARALSKIDVIVVVVILCAGLLAFIVLYNLTNINISERVKEIATIKVLGFTDREVNSYVNRESILLSIIGTIFGLVLGVFLHRYVMGCAEMTSMMFGRSVRAMSFVYSAALTIAFSVLVDLIMRRKLRNISMVESMKAPE
ncbi:MAG: ABC transporter permease [Oscillospiraceae bacterium]|nr:ABC transporter permease [Oscillospiraceae bacterium]